MDLYHTLVSLPAVYLSREDTVTIVPAFEFTLPKDAICDTFTGCILKYLLLLDYLSFIV